MNMTQALTALKKLYGKNAMWRYDERAPLADERERFSSLMPTLAMMKRETSEAAEARRRALLAADDEYQRLLFAAQSADTAWKEARGMSHWFRVTVGRSIGIGMEVKAQADNWQDAIDQAREKGRLVP